MIQKVLVRFFVGLLLLLLSYFVLSKAAITWIQYSPAKSTEFLSKLFGAETNYEKLQIKQSWSGFELEASDLVVASQRAELAVKAIKLDLNLFTLFSPGLPVGEKFFAEQIKLQTFETATKSSESRAGSGGLISEKIYKLLSKSWRNISISNFVFIPYQDENFHVLVSEFNSQNPDDWQVLAEIKFFKYSQNLADFNFKAEFSLDGFSRLRSGSFTLAQQGSSSIESLALIWPFGKDLISKFSAGEYELAAFGEVENYQLKSAIASSKITNLCFDSAGNLLDFPLLNLSAARIGEGLTRLTLDFPEPIVFNTEYTEQQHYQIMPNQAWLVDFNANDESWRLVDTAQFSLNGVPANLNGKGDFHGQVDLALAAEIEDIHFLKHHFLPYPMMEQALVDWLKNSLVGGHSIKADAVLQGNLQDFPFTNSPGEFYAKAVMQDSELKFNPDWPSIKDFVALVEFRPFDLTISSKHGKIFGADAHDIVVDFDNLHTKDVAVEVKAHAYSDSQNALDFLLASPLAKHLGMEGLLQGNLSGEGRLRVDLDKLFVPVSGFEGRDIEVLGKVQLRDKLHLVNLLELDNLSGNLWFSEKALWADKPIKTKLFGGTHQVLVKTDLDSKNVLITSDGNFLLNEFGLRGKAPVRSTTKVPFGSGLLDEVKVDIEVFPYQLTSIWPAPFDKASLVKPVQIKVDIKSGKELYQAKFSDDFQLNFQQQLAQNGSLKQGVKITGRLNKLDLDAWLAAKDQLEKHLPAGFAQQETGQGSENPEAAPIYWQKSSFQIDEILLLGQAYQPIDLSWQSTGNQTKWQVKSKEIDLKISQIAEDLPRFVVHTDLLHIKLPEETKGAATKSKKPKPTKAPSQAAAQKEPAENCALASNQAWLALEFKGSNVLVGSRMLNNLEFELKNDQQGWQIDNASFVALNGSANGSLSYKFVPENDQSLVNLELNSTDVARFTSFIGAKKGFTGNKAKLKADLTWPGGPACYATENLTGQYSGQLQNGVIEEIEPGLARLIGLLSVDSLARRLKLDLKDVTDKGLEYSKLDLKGSFDSTYYYLEDLKIVSPGVKLDLNGKIGTKDLKLDLNAEVTPAIGSALPALAGITAMANPVTGLIAYLVAKNLPFINEDLVSYKYEVTGEIEEPNLKLKGASVLFK